MFQESLICERVSLLNLLLYYNRIHYKFLIDLHQLVFGLIHPKILNHILIKILIYEYVCITKTSK